MILKSSDSRFNGRAGYQCTQPGQRNDRYRLGCIEECTVMKVGVVGGTGYAGAELIRLLLMHPRVELAEVVSHSQSGMRLDVLHPGLQGCTELVAQSFEPQRLAQLDAVFVAVPHGKAAPLCDALHAAGAKVILDLSRDHRHAEGWVYGLAEWNTTQLPGAGRIAVPGCFATAISMATAPFVASGEVVDAPRIVAATGSTGLGATPAKSGHHPERFTNPQSIQDFESSAWSRDQYISFWSESCRPDSICSTLGPHRSRILATAMLPMKRAWSLEEAQETLKEKYAQHPLVRVREGSPEIRHVRGTAFCDVAAFVDGKDVVVISAIDNLGKGASTQAVQCLNHAFDWPVQTGLTHPPALP